jgi:integrase
LFEKNPARMVELPATQRTVQPIPSPAEVEQLLDTLAKEPRHYRTFYLLSLYTGCRRGELCALQWSDFTPCRNGLLLTVSRSRTNVPGKGIVEGSTKNGRSREIYLPADLCGILRSYRRRKDTEAAQARRKLSPYLFTDAHGQLIHPDTFTKRLRKIYQSIGFPKEYHLHTLRHYFVTALLHSGVDKQTVADLAGHGDTGFLERTYCHPQQAQKEQAANTMGTVLRPDGSPMFNLAAACMQKRRGA